MDEKKEAGELLSSEQTPASTGTITHKEDPKERKLCMESIHCAALQLIKCVDTKELKGFIIANSVLPIIKKFADEKKDYPDAFFLFALIEQLSMFVIMARASIIGLVTEEIDKNGLKDSVITSDTLKNISSVFDSVDSLIARLRRIAYTLPTVPVQAPCGN